MWCDQYHSSCAIYAVSHRIPVDLQVTPLCNASEPAAWSTAYEGGSNFVYSSEVGDFSAELSRLVKSIDNATSRGQRDIQIQVLHVEEQIGKMSSISKAMGQLCAPASSPASTRIAYYLHCTALCLACNRHLLRVRRFAVPLLQMRVQSFHASRRPHIYV